MRNILNSRSSAPLAAKSATSSPCRSAVRTIASSPSAVTNLHGGNSSMSIRCRWHGDYGSIHDRMAATPQQREIRSLKLCNRDEMQRQTGRLVPPPEILWTASSNERMRVAVSHQCSAAIVYRRSKSGTRILRRDDNVSGMYAIAHGQGASGFCLV